MAASVSLSSTTWLVSAMISRTARAQTFKSFSPFSEKLIREAGIPYVLPPEEAEDFFAETVPSEELLAKVTELVIYRWNRHYPSDIRWEPDLKAMGFVLQETGEFPGTSHEKITREVYVR